MLNGNISITPSNINALGMQLSNISKTGSNKNAQSQYFQDGKQYKCSMTIFPKRRAILMLLECNLIIFPQRQAMKMLHSYIPRTASNKNAQ